MATNLKTNSTPTIEYNYIGKILDDKDKGHFINTKLIMTKTPQRINGEPSGLFFYKASIVVHENVQIPVRDFNQTKYNVITMARNLKTRSGAEAHTIPTISQIWEGTSRKAGEEPRVYHVVETIVVGGDKPFIISEFLKTADFGFLKQLQSTGVAFKDLVVPVRKETVVLEEGQSLGSILNITKKTEETDTAD